MGGGGQGYPVLSLWFALLHCLEQSSCPDFQCGLRIEVSEKPSPRFACVGAADKGQLLVSGTEHRCQPAAQALDQELQQVPPPAQRGLPERF